MSSSDSDRKLAFWTFPHAYLRRLVEALTDALCAPAGTQLHVVTGPPGVGKSKLGEILENQLAWRFRSEMEADATRVPVIRAEAPAAIGPQFSHRDLFLTLLRALGDPAVDRLIGADLLTGKAPNDVRPGRLGSNELFGVTVRRFKNRQVRVVILDEAQHLGVAPSIRGLRADLDVLKSIANLAGVRIVLLGTYELDDFGRASPQLGRRTTTHHFPRYRWEDPRERLEFEGVVRAMLASIAGLSEPDADASIDACYERTMGCVGILRDWLVNAEAAWEAGRWQWSTCLARTAPSDGKVESMVDAIADAERRLGPVYRRRDSLRRKLGMEPLTGAQSGHAKTEATRPQRVGRRKPKRDRVGI